MKCASNRVLFPALVWCLFAVGCESETPRPKQPAGDKPVVASRPGIVQVGGPNDPVIDEATACSRFRTALESNWTRLNCGEVVIQECPELVHPLVELPCVMYSDPSVSQCEQIFDEAQTCADLGPGSCVLTAILDPTDAMGLPLECDERDSTDSSSPTGADAGSSNTGNSDAGGADASGFGTLDASSPSGASDAGRPDAGQDRTVDAALDGGQSDANGSSAANDAATSS